MPVRFVPESRFWLRYRYTNAPVAVKGRPVSHGDRPMRPVLLLLLLVLLVGGCAASAPKVTYVADQRYQPTAVVDRLRIPPGTPYVVLAEMSWITSQEQATRRDVEDMMLEEARKLGANAVIFGKSKDTAMGNVGDMDRYLQSDSYSAVAIRYR